jgi:hypothetical protein
VKPVAGRLEHAHARIRARWGARSDEALWQRLELTRELGALLDLARGSAAAAWLADDPRPHPLQRPRAASGREAAAAASPDADLLRGLLDAARAAPSVLPSRLLALCTPRHCARSCRARPRSRRARESPATWFPICRRWPSAPVRSGARGTLTQLSILAMPADDISHPIPDLTDYITEGQTVLSRELDRRAVCPPVDMLPSLSRLMKGGTGGRDIHPDHPALASRLYTAYAGAAQARVLASVVGAEGLAAADRQNLAFGQAFEGWLVHHEGPRLLEQSTAVGWELLAGEMLRQLQQHARLGRRLADAHEAAMDALRAAPGRHGLQGLQGLQMVPPLEDASARLGISPSSLMGVPLQQAQRTPGSSAPEPPSTAPSPEGRSCRRAFAAYAAAAAPLAAVTGNLGRPSQEYRRSVRRARALQDVALPEIEHDVAGIETPLEELKQPDALAMRRPPA